MQQRNPIEEKINELQSLRRSGVRFVRIGKKILIDIRCRIEWLKNPKLLSAPAWVALGHQQPN